MRKVLFYEVTHKFIYPNNAFTQKDKGDNDYSQPNYSKDILGGCNYPMVCSKKIFDRTSDDGITDKENSSNKEAAAKRFDEGLFPQQKSEPTKRAVPVGRVSF